MKSYINEEDMDSIQNNAEIGSDRNLIKSIARDQKEVSEKQQSYKTLQPEPRSKELEQHSVITYQNSTKNTLGIQEIKESEESKRLWQNHEELQEIPKNEECHERRCGEQLRNEILIVNYEHQYSKEPNRILKSEEYDSKDEGNDENQNKTSHRESAIQVLHQNDGGNSLVEQETKVIHSNNQYHQTKHNSISQFMTSRTLTSNYIKEEYRNQEECSEDGEKSYGVQKIMGCLPDFQQSYRGSSDVENQRRKGPSRYVEKLDVETKKIMRIDRNVRMVYAPEQNKSTIHHYPERDLYGSQGIHNIENVDQNRGFSNRHERAMEYRGVEEMRYVTTEVENVKVDQPRFSVMTHADRDPMLGDSYAASQKVVSYPIDYQKMASTEYQVKYEDSTDPMSSRQEIDQQNQLVVKNPNQIIHPEPLHTSITETGTTTYTTLQTVSHPPTNAFNNLYPTNEYHDSYTQKPSNSDIYEINRGNEDIYNKASGICYRNKPEIHQGFGHKLEGSVIGYPGTYISEGGQRLSSIAPSDDVHAEFVIKQDVSGSVMGSNKISGRIAFLFFPLSALFSRLTLIFNFRAIGSSIRTATAY